ncbi:MAG: hypothetical protein OXI01_09885 [Albidovulum sp.]|nr:hypothetical protein [Albidovulum sp.]
MDSSSSVLDIGQGRDLAAVSHQRQAGPSRPRIDNSIERLALPPGPVPEPDSEKIEASHDGAPHFQKRPRPRLMVRHKRVAPPPDEDENAAYAALVVAGTSPVTPAKVGLPSHNLTTRNPIRPVSSLTRRFCKRTVQSLGMRKHPTVGP